MAVITAKDVAALRAKTGIGMMECKKALVEADGDMEAAVKILREKAATDPPVRYLLGLPPQTRLLRLAPLKKLAPILVF